MAKVYMATVPTYYVTYAIADSEERAKRLALTKALRYLKADGSPDSAAKLYGYRTTKDVDEALGCNVYEFPGMNTAILE